MDPVPTVNCRISDCAIFNCRYFYTPIPHAATSPRRIPRKPHRRHILHRLVVLLLYTARPQLQAQNVSTATTALPDNHSTHGLSPDFVWVNPLGFLALTLWNWGAYFSPVARKQYQDRHHGHLPQVSTSDLAFSLHALIISTITLAQVFWYGYFRQLLTGHSSSDQHSDEASPLISDSVHNSAAGDDSESSNLVIFHSPIRPSPVAQLFLGGIVISPFVYAIFVWTGKAQFLDWLYYVGNIKVVISAVKYIPQVVLNHRMRAVNGFAIGVIICVGSKVNLL